MSRHLIICLPEEGLTLNNYQHPTSASPIETGAIKSGLSNLIVILQGIRVGSVEEHNQYSLKLPQRIQSSSPGKMEFISPSSKLIPSKFWKLIPSQGTNASPGFIQRVISLTEYNWVLPSQQPRKEPRRQSLLIPSEVY